MNLESREGLTRAYREQLWVAIQVAFHGVSPSCSPDCRRFLRCEFGVHPADEGDAIR
jgi:hypothetical protein